MICNVGSPQGVIFNYSTGDSCLLGALAAAARAGRCLEWGGFGVCACLRDVGRFGKLVLEDGEAFSGRWVLPPGWRDLAGQPAHTSVG